MIPASIRPSLVAACLVALASAGGCGDGSISVSSSTTEAQVRGAVKINGKPASDGFVVFDPANIRRRDATIRRAKIEKDGTFSLTTLVGENQVSVEGPAISRAGLEIASRRTIDVASGDNSIDIEVPARSDATTKKAPRR